MTWWGEVRWSGGVSNDTCDTATLLRLVVVNYCWLVGNHNFIVIALAMVF